MEPTDILHDATIFDTHTHPVGYLPRMAATVFRTINRNSMPKDFPLGRLSQVGVTAVVANAVGDPVATRWQRGTSWGVVKARVQMIKREAQRAGLQVVTSASEVEERRHTGRLSVVLGVEGIDAIGRELSHLDDLQRFGVRLIAPIHLTTNGIGSTRRPWQRYVFRKSGHKSDVGLTSFGFSVIERTNNLRILVDVSHCSPQTLHDIVSFSKYPVIASHSGCRALQNFDRYLDDDEIQSIARAGGLIGLWPYYRLGNGTKDLAELMRHARYLSDLVGPSHICLGTDMNGLPGAMSGYRDGADVVEIIREIAREFPHEEARAILGGNFLRVFATVAGS